MLTAQARQLEDTLRARTAPTLFPQEMTGEFVLPAYDGYSLANVPATLAALLGGMLPNSAPPLDAVYWQGLGEGVRRVILVLIDALGYLPLGERMTAEPDTLWARLAARGRLLPMTSIYPSTTSAALATLLTGVEPIRHGLLGYELWLREYGTLTEMLALKPVYGTGHELLSEWGLVPERFLPVPGLGTLLGRQGIVTTALVPARFANGTLTRMCYRGFGRMFGYTNVEGMWSLTLHALSQDRAARSLYTLYWGGIDTAIHRNGSQSGIWQAQYEAVTRACEERFLARLTPQQRAGTLLVMVADHGFVDAPEDQAHDTDADLVLRRELLIPYSGEARAGFLHCADGPTVRAQQAVQDALGRGFVVCPTTNVVAAGLFGAGAPGPESLTRLGHLQVIARGQHYLDRMGKRKELRGRHGGLHPREMLIPWLATRLDT